MSRRQYVLMLSVFVFLALSFLAPIRFQSCAPYTITAYWRLDPHMNAHTYDGTSITTDERIVAASWNLPIDTIIEVEGFGVYRVADRGGGLGPRHIDIATWTYDEAIRIGRQTRVVCVLT